MKKANWIIGLEIVTVAALIIAGASLGAVADCGKCGAKAAKQTTTTPCPFLDENADTKPTAKTADIDCPGMVGAARGRHAHQGHGATGDHQTTIHALLDHHEAIERHVVRIEGGVETTTTSSDPRVVELIRRHVRDMKRRVESGHGMRWWDPTFSELFKHHKKIAMQIEDIEDGVRVRETSKDPAVTRLIRQHAVRGVSEFVAEGHVRARRATPLPDGYGEEPEGPGKN